LHVLLGDPTAVLAEKGAAIAALQNRFKKQPTLANSAEVQQQLIAMRDALEAGNLGFQEFLDDLKRHFDQTAAVASIDTKVTQGLQSDLAELKHGAVAIYTLVTPERHVALLVTPDGQKDYESKIKFTDLNQKILAFREMIEDPRSDPGPLAGELYKILIPQALATALRNAKAETLMWSLDGPLRYVPIAALHDGKQYLVEKYRIAFLTAASNASLPDRMGERASPARSLQSDRRAGRRVLQASRHVPRIRSSV
jgi:CHAT domain-containing protein